MEMPAKPLRRAGCLLAFILAAILCEQPALKAFAPHEQGKPEKRGEPTGNSAFGLGHGLLHRQGLLSARRFTSEASLSFAAKCSRAVGNRDRPECKVETRARKVEHWDWFENPFVGTRELDGLRALMALIKNWDLTTQNNKVYVADNERYYLVSELAAAFGKTGWPPSDLPLFPHATKGVLKDYERSRFIRAVKGATVTFEMRTTAPFFVRVFRRKYFNKYKQAERLERAIPVVDAEWIGSWRG
jgi:hypothetical protein